MRLFDLITGERNASRDGAGLTSQTDTNKAGGLGLGWGLNLRQQAFSLFEGGDEKKKKGK